MKYIRIYNRILENKKLTIKDDCVQIWKTIDGKKTCDSYKIIKEADDPKELVDYFAVVHEVWNCDSGNTMYKSFDKALKHLKVGEHLVGGCWTREGFIFMILYANRPDKVWEVLGK